jgi:hypothetical protein
VVGVGIDDAIALDSLRPALDVTEPDVASGALLVSTLSNDGQLLLEVDLPAIHQEHQRSINMSAVAIGGLSFLAVLGTCLLYARRGAPGRESGLGVSAVAQTAVIGGVAVLGLLLLVWGFVLL